MAIPKFKECFNDFLLCLADGEPRKITDICEFIAKQKNLSDEDRAVTLNSGQRSFNNRVGWARTYLKMAGLVYYPKFSFVQITAEGKNVLSQNQIINLDFLKKYESFKKFQSRSSSEKDDGEISDEINKNDPSPHEQIETAFLQINAQLADEIIDEIFKLTPALFEKLTLRLLEKMGYGGTLSGIGTVTKMSGDGGIDVIISEDKLGLRNIYIQAKRYALDVSIGRPEIQGFVGAIANKDSKGVFITTSKYSEPAKQCAKENHIVLIDGERLAALMIEYGVGVSTVQTYEIKRIDSDFFTDLDL